tara:strand:+ start:309 stop:1508 length:1200 start_codon:yes stop_codon:yes gene_type:complete
MNIINNLPKSIKKLHPNIYPVSSKGSFVFTANKSKYLDLTSGIGALSTGHNHPYIVNRVTNQLKQYVHFQQHIFKSHPVQAELTQKILATMPDESLDNILYLNSGSEATDNSIRIARKYTRKPNIIAMNKGFHGRSIGALSVTSSNISCREGLSPLLPNVFFCHDFTKSSLENIFEYQSSPFDTAGIILEPVQGEGGIYSIDSEFLKYVEEVCQEHNILLIADEVQCGAMRTGTWWNFEQKGITPDIMTFGKGIASGYPLAGVISSSRIMNSLGEGYLGGTYGGNAIASAAASATIDILNNDDIQKNVNEMGKYIKDNLIDEPIIKEIRQYGLMIAIEFTFSNQNPYYTKEIVEQLAEEGILVLLAGNKNQYIRLLPPLNISKEEIDLFILKFKTIWLF